MNINIKENTPFDLIEVKYLHSGDYFICNKKLYLVIEGSTEIDRHNDDINNSDMYLCFNLIDQTKVHVYINTTVIKCKEINITYSLI